MKKMDLLGLLSEYGTPSIQTVSHPDGGASLEMLWKYSYTDAYTGEETRFSGTAGIVAATEPGGSGWYVACMIEDSNDIMERSAAFPELEQLWASKS